MRQKIIGNGGDKPFPAQADVKKTDATSIVPVDGDIAGFSSSITSNWSFIQKPGIGTLFCCITEK
jgi:hypothetical protein